MSFVYAVGIAFTGLLVHYIARRPATTPLPPGPKGLPLIGVRSTPCPSSTDVFGSECTGHAHRREGLADLC